MAVLACSPLIFLWINGKEKGLWPLPLVCASSVMFAAAAAKSLQSCPTLCDPIDGSPLGSPIPGILQARILEWVAISFSNAWKWKVKGKSLSRVQLFETPWTAACQATLPMGFSRQEYWSGLPLPSPGVMFKGKDRSSGKVPVVTHFQSHLQSHSSHCHHCTTSLKTY